MDVRIKPRKLHGKVKAISSKSYLHRYLICAAFSDRPSKIHFNGCAEDIDATISCLSALGVKIDKKNYNCFLITPPKNIRSDIIINCKESGSTLRFMLPIIAALGISARIVGEGRLVERPILPLIKELSKHGINFSDNRLPFHMSGRLKGDYYEMSGDVSSQFISGLLLAAPLRMKEMEINITSNLESKGYVEITIDVMKKFGISVVDGQASNFVVNPSEGYTTYGDVIVEGDWSNAAVWLAAGAISDGIVTCHGLNPNSKQPDKKVLEKLMEYGAYISSNNESVSVTGLDNRYIEIDASECPDLVPILATIASVAKGKTKIFNARRLKLKESDRLKSTCAMLINLGADVTLSEDTLEINGRKELSGGTTESFGDHRIVMAAAIAACACKNDVTIRDVEAINKSYPNFFDDYVNLGGNICVF